MLMHEKVRMRAVVEMVLRIGSHCRGLGLLVVVVRKYRQQHLEDGCRCEVEKAHVFDSGLGKSAGSHRRQQQQQH